MGAAALCVLRARFFRFDVRRLGTAMGGQLEMVKGMSNRTMVAPFAAHPSDCLYWFQAGSCTGPR